MFIDAEIAMLAFGKYIYFVLTTLSQPIEDTRMASLYWYTFFDGNGMPFIMISVCTQYCNDQELADRQPCGLTASPSCCGSVNKHLKGTTYHTYAPVLSGTDSSTLQATKATWQ